MVDLYCRELKSILKQRCIFFGHSMGGIVAVFTAQRVIDSPEYRVKPSGLIVSAVDSPDRLPRHRMAMKSDAAIVDYLISIGGIPAELQRETTLLAYFAPTFRADFAALENVVVPQPITPLDLPVRLLRGSDDPTVTVESIRRWQHYFSRGVDEITIDGGHMFVIENAAAVARHIEDMFEDVG